MGKSGDDMKLTGIKGNIYYGTSNGEFIRQRLQFCVCSFCLRVFEFNERVIYFHDRTTNYYTCLEHELQMREKQIIEYEARMKSQIAWESKKKKLIADLKIKKTKNSEERIKE